MLETVTQPKDNDVFDWSYPSADARPWGDYHCCSRIGIFRKGRLYDTYWQIGESFHNGRSFSAEDIGPKIDVIFRGNLADYERVPEYQADYYAAADILDLNHPNSTRGNFYLRRGAVRSIEKMLAVARARLEKSEAEERYAASCSVRCRETLAKIEAGDTTVYF